MISNKLHKIVDKNVLFQTGKIKRSEQYNNRCRSIYIKKQTNQIILDLYSDKTIMGAVTIY